MQIAIVLYPGLTALDAVGLPATTHWMVQPALAAMGAKHPSELRAIPTIAWRRALTEFRARATTRLRKGVHR